MANEFDDYAERRARQLHLPPGLIHDGDGVRIWVKTWAEVLEDCQQRLKFVQDNLDYRSTHDQAIGYLRETYARFLPGLVGEDEPSDEGEQTAA